MKKITTPTILLVLAIILSACNLPTGGQTDPPETSGDGLTPLQPALSDTPQFTFTPSDTLEPSLTFTPEVPMVSVSTETNCRTGPGTAYDRVTVLLVGQQAQVVGRSSDGGTWIIINPANPSQVCWLWGQYATLVGNTSNLPVATQPHTPTPAAGFTFTFLGLVTCLPSYALRFEIRNVGATTWQSVKIDMTDSDTATTRTHTSDSFNDRTACPVINTLQDLEPNEVGNLATAAPGHFSYDPTGHNITVTITMYSQNGLAGESTTRTISVTP